MVAELAVSEIEIASGQLCSIISQARAIMGLSWRATLPSTHSSLSVEVEAAPLLRANPNWRAKAPGINLTLLTLTLLNLSILL